MSSSYSALDKANEEADKSIITDDSCKCSKVPTDSNDTTVSPSASDEDVNSSGENSENEFSDDESISNDKNKPTFKVCSIL